jgi:hypothetical protein
MYKVTLVIAFMADVHNVIGKLSCQLQKQYILFSEIQPLMDAALADNNHEQPELHFLTPSILLHKVPSH